LAYLSREFVEPCDRIGEEYRSCLFGVDDQKDLVSRSDRIQRLYVFPIQANGAEKLGNGDAVVIDSHSAREDFRTQVKERGQHDNHE